MFFAASAIPEHQNQTFKFSLKNRREKLTEVGGGGGGGFAGF